MAIKLEREGGYALMAWPLVEELFFCFLKSGEKYEQQSCGSEINRIRRTDAQEKDPDKQLHDCLNV